MFPNKSQAIAVTLLFMATPLVVAQVLVHFGVRWRAGNSTIYIIISLISTYLILQFVLPKMGLRFAEIFHANFNKWSVIVSLSILPIAFAMLGLQVLLSNISIVVLYLFPGADIYSESFDALFSSGISGLLVICVVAPVVEEIIFRGVILRGLLSNYSKCDALIASATLFSLMHLNPIQLIPTLIAGIVLGWLYIKSYSLWPSIIAHMLFNAIPFIAYQFNSDDYEASMELTFLPIELQLLSIVFVVGAYFIVKYIFQKSTVVS